MIGQPVDAKISCVNSVIECPADVTVRFKSGPDSVLWSFGEIEAKVAYVEVRFDSGSPFTQMLAARGGGILGTGNTGKEGTYKYTVRVYDATGAVVASLDPRIINDPR